MKLKDMLIHFELFTISFYDYEVFIGFCGIDLGEFSGNLLYIEKTSVGWKFDVLYLRHFYYLWVFGR